MSKLALIFGITGQDGTLLAKFLLNKGYQVIGLTRGKSTTNYTNLEKTGILSQIEIRPLDLLNKNAISKLIDEAKPDEIYNLSGQSSVGYSFEKPLETFESHAMATLNLLEAIRLSSSSIRLFNAGSGECFGDSEIAISENMPLKPCSPYAVAKSSAYLSVANYRAAYDVYACTGVLFNHESPLRPDKFVTSKVINAACAIATGTQKKLTLGNLSVRRDWGWASEYVEAMWLMLQQPQAEDFVIATGESNSLEEFVAYAFSCVDLDWEEYVEISNDFIRTSEPVKLYGNPTKAKALLGWSASMKMKQVVRKMVDLTCAENHATHADQ